MFGFLDNGLLCELDSLRYVIEHNTGSVVILVGVVGFLFWRLQKFVADFLLLLYKWAPLGRKTKAALGECRLLGAGRDRDHCVRDVVEERAEKGLNLLNWLFELFLNLVAVSLITVGAILCYLIINPPEVCRVPGDYGISVPSTFKKIQNKGGELLYVDEANRSYLRIWPGARHEYRNGPTYEDLVQRYKDKKIAATKLKATTAAFEPDVAPRAGRLYFVLSWRDRDNFDVYFVSRLVPRGDGRMYIDSIEISSPVHGNALVGYDYNFLFCNFVRPAAPDLPEMCSRL